MKHFFLCLFSLLFVSISVEAVNTNWHSNSKSITSDLEVTSVNVPDSGCLMVIDIVATVTNNGPDAASGFNVTYRVNGTIPISSTVSGPLQSGESIGVTFPNQFDFGPPGTYSLEVWVTYGDDANSANDTLSKNVFSKEKPGVSMNGYVGCVGDSAVFEDNSVHTQGLTDWEWYVDNPNNIVDTGPQAMIFFPVKSQTIGLYVTAVNGCRDSLEMVYTANSNPQVGFTVSNDCENEPIQFFNQTQISGSIIDSFYWQFGDGLVATDTNPVHVYQTSGVYDVKLTAISNEGCADSFNALVEAFPSPESNFTHDMPECTETSLTFTDQSNISSGVISEWKWDFDNGQEDTGSTGQAIFETAGDFNVSLVTISGEGCRDTADLLITVHPSPEAFFTGDLVGCEMDTFNFQDKSMISSGEIVDLFWDFKDGNTSSDSIVEHVYVTAGGYDVVLTATSAAGCTGDTSLPVSVFEKPPKPVIKQKGDTLYIEVNGVFQWFREGTPVPNATDSFLVPDQPGEYIVEVAYIECSNRSDPFIVTGIGSAENEIDAHLFPNPTDGILKVHLNSGQIMNGNLSLWSVNGVQLMEEDVIKNVNSVNLQVDLNPFQSGIYFLIYKASNSGFQMVWPVQKIN